MLLQPSTRSFDCLRVSRHGALGPVYALLVLWLLLPMLFVVELGRFLAHTAGLPVRKLAEAELFRHVANVLRCLATKKQNISVTYPNCSWLL